MPKKYIQLLLSINFCLMAVAAIANSDSDRNITFTSEEFFMKETKDAFDQIWSCLEEINTIYQSESLQEFIRKNKNIETPYDENSEEISQSKLSEQFFDLLKSLGPSWEPSEQDLNEVSKNKLSAQQNRISSCLIPIEKYCRFISQNPSSKKERFFFINQCKKFQNIPFDELMENSILEEDLGKIESPTPQITNSHTENNQNSSTVALDLESSIEELNKGTLHLAKREADSTPESSSTRIELDNQFNQIWNCLDKMNAIHQSELLQRLISHHRDDEIPYNESLGEVNEDTLENQFIQLHKNLEICSQYQPKEELDAGSKAKLGIQLDQIERYLSTIHEVYRKKSLSKEEKAFLRDQLEELHNFSYHFITENSLQEENLDKIQILLNRCKEEDKLIYPQYEYIINDQETNISDILTSSQIENNIKSNFLYFNKAEGLIELQHIELLDEDEDKEYYKELYTTIWKIRPADVNLVKDWKEDDSITIDKTSIFSKYTMRGESLQYTLTNNNKSVRANFICKSSNRNTYTILLIDYLENIVVLKNGPCLFVQDGDLKEWHAKDTVVLQRFGSVTDTYNSHELINKTRHKKNWVFLKSWH